MRVKVRVIVLVAVFCSLPVSSCRLATAPRVSQSHMRTAADIRRAELQKELDRKWENPSAHFEIGQLYQAAGDWSKAEWHYNIALGFDPAYHDAQAAIVKVQLDKGDKQKAEWAAETYMMQASTPEQRAALGLAFEKQGLDDYALKCYEDALKTAPDSPVVNRQLGYYYLARNKKDSAKEYFIRSFQLNPNQPDVAGELGRLGVAVKVPVPAAPVPGQFSQPVQPASPSE